MVAAPKEMCCLHFAQTSVARGGWPEVLRREVTCVMIGIISAVSADEDHLANVESRLKADGEARPQPAPTPDPAKFEVKHPSDNPIYKQIDQLNREIAAFTGLRAADVPAGKSCGDGEK